MGLTDTTRPLVYGEPSEFLASDPRTVTLADGTKVIVTLDNYREVARQQIAAKAARGITLNSQEQIAVIDAMRQVAGLAPNAFKIDEFGAAGVSGSPLPTTTAAAFGERIFGIFTGETDVIGDAQHFYGKTLPDGLEPPLGKLETYALFGGLLFGLYLLARLKQ